MKTDKSDIYEQIGNLFYAIAADQHVQPLEVGELKSLISKDWLPLKLSESVVSEEAHGIIMAIDLMEANKATANDAFKEFLKFYKLHPDFFSKEIKQRMLDTAEDIALVFKGNNPIKGPHLIALRDLLNLGKVSA
jgi:hypothetical protein